MTDLNNATILIIDDSPDIIASLSSILRPQYRVLAARTGLAGIGIAQRQPDLSLVLLDVMMPGLDGYAVLAKLRESPLTSNIPVVLLTSLADEADEEKGFVHGAADYIPKPIKPALLLARVRSQLQAAARTSELAASEERLQAVINGATDAIFTFDQAGKIQSINAAGVKIFGYDHEEIVECTIGSLIPELASTEPRALIQNHLRSDAGSIAGSRQEFEGRRKDGLRFPMELALSEAKSDRASLFIGFARDLSHQRKAEANVERLRRERVTAIGGMAVSLAHEINQPFLATVAYLNTARQLLATPAAQRCATVEETLDLAASQLLRAGQIISHLREFVSSGEPNKTFQKLHELIREAHSFTVGTLRQANIEVTFQLNADNDRVLADKIQIKQVLVNLIRNARQAMSASQTRKLKIATTSIGGDMIRIDIIDTGDGISEAARARLFEPFVTTKDYGMGVGLSISRSIIEAHFGEIWADQNPEGGAIFSFTLPFEIQGGVVDE